MDPIFRERIRAPLSEQLQELKGFRREPHETIVPMQLTRPEIQQEVSEAQLHRLFKSYVTRIAR